MLDEPQPTSAPRARAPTSVRHPGALRRAARDPPRQGRRRAVQKPGREVQRHDRRAIPNADLPERRTLQLERADEARVASSASPLRGNDRVRHRRARPWFCEATMACSAALESVRTTSFASASGTSSRLAKSPSPTRVSSSARNAAMRRRGTRACAEASGSGTISSMASSFRSGFCDNFSCRSGAPILEPFVQALPVLPSCAPSAIQTR